VKFPIKNFVPIVNPITISIKNRTFDRKFKISIENGLLRSEILIGFNRNFRLGQIKCTRLFAGTACIGDCLYVAGGCKHGQTSRHLIQMAADDFTEERRKADMRFARWDVGLGVVEDK